MFREVEGWISGFQSVSQDCLFLSHWYRLECITENLAELLKDFSKLTRLRGKSFLFCAHCSFYVRGAHRDWCVFLSEWLHSSFLYSKGVGSLLWKSLLSEMMAFLYISRTTTQRKLPKKIGFSQFLPSSLCLYCLNLVIIGWAVCSPLLQQQDGGQGGK